MTQKDRKPLQNPPSFVGILRPQGWDIPLFLRHWWLSDTDVCASWRGGSLGTLILGIFLFMYYQWPWSHLDPTGSSNPLTQRGLFVSLESMVPILPTLSVGLEESSELYSLDARPRASRYTQRQGGHMVLIEESGWTPYGRQRPSNFLSYNPWKLDKYKYINHSLASSEKELWLPNLFTISPGFWDLSEFYWLVWI